MVNLALLGAFTFFSLAVDCRCAVAQSVSGKSTETKTQKESSVKRPSVFNPLVTFVEIGAARCIPCKAMQPIMKEVSEEYKGQVRVLFHDVWKQQGRIDAEKYNIRVIPTQVFLDVNDKEYYRHEGYFPKEGVVQVLKMGGVK
jgi:thioredoxin 1